MYKFNISTWIYQKGINNKEDKVGLKFINLNLNGFYSVK